MKSLPNIVVSLFALYSLNTSFNHSTTLFHQQKPDFGIKSQRQEYNIGIPILDDLINRFEEYRTIYNNLLEYENGRVKARIDPSNIKITFIINL
ncbi:MAG: hypothetical protein V1663_03295 [archaeon]